MSEGNLELQGAYEAWHGAAHRGRLVADGSFRDVLVLLGPEEVGADALPRARKAAIDALRLSGRGVLRLLQVSDYGGRVSWIYEHVEGIGLGHTVGVDGTALLSTRAAAEIVASVAETLLALGYAGLRHPGPEPADLMIDGKGRVYLSGFASPFPSSPSMRAPQVDTGEAAVVYRLGVLLAHLVAGIPPAPAAERTAHDALIRRTLIRAMARPGPVLTERYADWLRGMLAWEAAERPPLSAVPEGLRKVGEITGGERLESWAGAHVPEMLLRLGPEAEVDDPDADTAEVGAIDQVQTEETTSKRSPAVMRTPPPQRPRRLPTDPATDPSIARPRGAELATDPNLTRPPRPMVPSETPTLRAVQQIPAPALEDFTDDDPTQEAAHLPRFGSASEPPGGSIPVGVGPPPELAGRAPRLPKGFLEEDRWDPETQEPSVGGGGGPSVGRVVLTLGWIAAMLLVCAAASVALAYLLIRHQGEAVVAIPVHEVGPTLSEALADLPKTEVTPPKTPSDASSSTVVPPVVDPLPPVVETPPPPVETKTTPPKKTTSKKTPPKKTTAAAKTTPAQPPAGFSVLFRSTDALAVVRVVCQSASKSSAGQVRIFGLKDETCTVTADLGRGPLVATYHVTEAATVECFEDGVAVCR